MPTLTSAKDLPYSYPIAVHFAGFRGDTYSLGKHGWDISINQYRDMYSAAHSLQLALRHEAAKMYAITNRVLIEDWALARATESTHEYVRFLQSVEFHVQAMAPSISFQVMPTSVASFRLGFEPIDTIPQVRPAYEEVSIASFKFFKTVKPSVKDILVTPDQVPELLDLVLKAQAPTQQDIKKRMRSRENMERFGDLLAPSTEVHARILTVA